MGDLLGPSHIFIFHFDYSLGLCLGIFLFCLFWGFFTGTSLLELFSGTFYGYFFIGTFPSVAFILDLLSILFFSEPIINTIFGHLAGCVS